MSGGFANYLVTKAGNLVRTFMQSPDFVSGSAGWRISKDGSAEFNNVTIRGAEIVGGTALYYSTPAPQANTLVVSIAAAAGTDSAGNAYFAGLTEYGKSGLTYYAVNVATGTGNGETFGGTVEVFTGASMAAWSAQSTIALTGSGEIELTLTQLKIRPVNGALANAPIVLGEPGTPGVTETWHDISLLNSWSLGSGGYAQYKMGAENRVYVRGANVIPGTVTGGTNIWTIPSLYVPGSQVGRIPMIVEVSTGAAIVDSPRFDATTGGQFQVFNIPGSTTRVGWNDSFALD